MMMNAANLVIGCDHAAFQLKETLKAYLKNNGYAVDDVGAFSVASVDYPEIGATLASQISAGTYRRGILMCGTGLGMSMVANRFPHVRAALCNDLFSAIMSRKHNDANVLVMGGRVVGDVLAIEILNAWMKTSFEGDRHQRRIDMFDAKPQ
jgi:ribose 5-phosphate isomerase B